MENIIPQTPSQQASQNVLESAVQQELQRALIAAAGVHCAYGQNAESENPVGSPALAADRVSVDENPQDTIAYPWNPADPAAESFFEQAEQESVFAGWSDAEIATRATAFFAQVDQLWAPAAFATPVAASLQSKLAQKFAQQVPENLLAVIAQQAQAVVASSLSIADQLVHCVETVLPSFAVEDLQVLARPLAYAMRGDADATPWDTLLNNVRPIQWDALSEIEQARISLAIARYAIAELVETGDR